MMECGKRTANTPCTAKHECSERVANIYLRCGNAVGAKRSKIVSFSAARPEETGVRALKD